MNEIRIDLRRTLGKVSRNIFGGFAEHLGRCIYGGIYEPDSQLADQHGFRSDVLDALKQLAMPIIRYPGGNFVSGYRWKDGVGLLAERPARTDLAWHTVESNQFGTNEFIQFCRKLGAEPYLVVNCGDGTMREARDWVEYCNGSAESALVKLRRAHGVDAPHQVKYWGIGNEVDGPWQIGSKTPQEYARTVTEYGKVMKWVDPAIKLVAATVSVWEENLVERGQLLLEQAGDLIDYMALHWYLGNPQDDYDEYMALSELIEARLSAYEGLIRALRFDNQITRPIWIAVDEWNVWYRTHPGYGNTPDNLEEKFNLEDALVVALQMNAFIRHAYSVKMANLAQIVNVIAPVFTSPESLFRQTIFHPFWVYSSTCGDVALDVQWESDTFSGGGHTGVRVLDVAATWHSARKQVVVYVVNRSQHREIETHITLSDGTATRQVEAHIINGDNIKAENSFAAPNRVAARREATNLSGRSFVYAFEPHSVTALVCTVS